MVKERGVKLKNQFRFFIILCLFVFSVVSFVYAQENIKSAAQISSEEEFRRGVLAFYRGGYNEAILQFEKALSYTPYDNRILEWLGKAYYQSGMESSALKQWEYASNAGYGGLLLKNRIKILKERRLSSTIKNEHQRYVDTGSFLGNQDNVLRFSNPMCILPKDDGSIWVTAFGSNELVLLDLNGYVISRVRGPINGFDRPMDIVSTSDGKLIITEYAGDRITFLDSKGNFIKSVGKKGRGLGQLLGPQYLCVDEKKSRIFVTDFGNNRVCVFDILGTPLFDFGKASKNFSGLKAPTGIATYNGFVYVADADLGGIYIFDDSGNYVDILVNEKTFEKLEALKLWKNYLILTDKNKVYAVDILSGKINQMANLGNKPTELICGVCDVNNNLVVTDIKNNEVHVLAKMSELIGGFFVNVDKVYAKDFPTVTVDVKIENHNRNPIVGLKSSNFILTEKSKVVENLQFVGAAYKNDVCDIVVIIDRLKSNSKYEKEIEVVIKEIAQNMKGGTLSIVSSSNNPVLELSGKPEDFFNFSCKILKNPYKDVSSLDLALRLAGNNLIQGQAKKAIVYLASENFSKDAFNKYSYSETASWMNNNGIIFTLINLCLQKINEPLEYLSKTVVGNSYYVYQSEGLASIVKDILSFSNGLYRLTYTSKLPTDFGRAYLPIEVEVYLHNRSGRDETGYFAPLQ